jgi:hypothetical protein
MKMFLSALVMFAIGTVVSHAEEDLSMSGETRGQTVVECARGSGSITLTLSRFPAVRTPEEGNFKGGIGKRRHNSILNKDDFVVYPEEAQNFNGATFYLFGMGEDWKNMPKHVDQLEVNKALATGKVSDGRVTLSVKTKSDIKWNRFNGMVATAKGSGWVGMENQSGYLARDRGGNPLLVVGRQCETPTPAAIEKVSKME